MTRLRILPVLALLALGACSSSTGMGGDSGSFSVESSYDAAAFEEAGEIPGPREIVTTGSLTIVAEEVDDATEGIVAVVDDAGGRVESRSETAATEHRPQSAHLTVRVPADALTQTINEIESLGEVRDLFLTSDDVTRYGQDLDARIRALETSTERLIELMVDADSSEALIAAETALSERQADLEALKAERAYLSDQVAMSTLEISVMTEADPEFRPGGFLGGLKAGWNALVRFASGTLVAVGAAIPWIVVVGVPVTAILWSIRWRRTRRRRVATSPGAPGADTPAPDSPTPDSSDPAP